MKYKEYEIKIGDNPSLNEAVQKKAFELGAGWTNSGKKVQHTKADYIFINSKGVISYERLDGSIFVDNRYEKISIRDFFKLTKEDVIVKPETKAYMLGEKSLKNIPMPFS